ncbi:MAG: 3'-5' exoribonuclease [Methylococcales bacterium]|jgi:hypothetical protein|nr:3'-5' exoribonuclease [Methylococcales bacterium]MBT7410862.1 3'-5' exoribonuclease [Methylococcales bacterium]
MNINEPQIMIDLETMSTKSNAVIISIGAVAFNSGGVFDQFYENIDIESSARFGLDICPKTIKWWMKQSDEARKPLTENVLDIENALIEFALWVNSRVGEEAKIWGNGADFDNVILSSAYSATELQQPWKYWNNMCFRTLKNQYPEIKHCHEGVKHNALADAQSQAEHAIKIFGVMKGNSCNP